MISFNTKDYNVPAIQRESKLFNLTTQSDFRVYGLAQKCKNPPILIECEKETFALQQAPLKELMSFFQKRGMPLEIGVDNSSEKGKIYIGLRRDLRDHTLLSAATLQTIIYFLENRLDLDKTYKIPGIPKLVPHATVAPKRTKKKLRDAAITEALPKQWNASSLFYPNRRPSN